MSRYFFFCFLALPFLFSTCKKVSHEGDHLNSAIKYYSGGKQDKVQSVIRTNDGGFLFIGYTLIQSNTNGFLLKVNGQGKQEWYKTFGGNNVDVLIQGLHCSDGGFIAVGYTNSIGFDTQAAKYSAYAIRVNENGELVWEKSYGALECEFRYILETAEHTFLATGSDVTGIRNTILVSLEGNGNLKYFRDYRSFSTIEPLLLSNTYNNYGIGLAESNNGNYFIGGIMSKSNLVTEVSTFVTYLLEVPKLGLPMKYLYPLYDFPRSYTYMFSSGLTGIWRYPPVIIKKASDGGFLVATYLETPGPNMKMQLIKTNAYGNLLAPVWTKEYSGLGNAILNDFLDNGDGTYSLIGCSSPGNFTSSYPEFFDGLKTMVLRVDQNGNALKTHYSGSGTTSNIASTLQSKNNGDYVVAGYSSNKENGYHKLFTIQFNQEGNITSNE